MNAANDIGPGHRQQVVVALQGLRVIAQDAPPKILLGQPVALDHRAHRSVEDENALGGQGVQGSGSFRGTLGRRKCGTRWKFNRHQRMQKI